MKKEAFSQQSCAPIFILYLAMLFLLSACHTDEVIEEHAFLMGTMVSVTVAESEKDSQVRLAIKASMQEIQRVEALFSTHLDNSVQAFNQSHVGVWQDLDPEVSVLLAQAVRIMAQSQQAFHPMLGQLKQLWAFQSESKQVPPEASIQILVQAIKKATLEQKGTQWRRSHAALRLDFGAIAKGYAIDRAIKVLRQQGIGNAIVNAGGDIRLIGQRFGRAWRIGIKHPRQANQILGWMALKGDVSLVTSGDYERFFIVGDKRYHHILDARTGYPATKSQSVTVIAKNATLADAWSTALFVLGSNSQGLVTAPTDLDYLIVDRQGKKSMSLGMQKLFHSQ
ncbi:MAG: FAD:protein FMN transferase [Mariprofundaceae bacterium]|nr:FAD:protein FMN transferase [Mariprofundaceae bacterium]